MGHETKDECAPRWGLSVTGAVGGAAYTGHAIDCRPFRRGESYVHVARQASLVGGAETMDFTLQSSLPPILHPDRYVFDGVNDGDIDLAAVAATNLQSATRFTTVGACSIHKVSGWFHRVGTPALAAGGIPNIQAEIFTEAGGVPVASLGVRVNVPTASIPITAAGAKVDFTLQVPVDLAAATNYFVVFTANYDVSAANYIAQHFNTVAAPAQRSCVFGVAWAALGLQNLWVDMTYLVFAAEAALVLPQVAHSQVLDDIIADHNERRQFHVNQLVNGPYIRPVITVGAGAVVWNLGVMEVILSDPLVLPTNVNLFIAP